MKILSLFDGISCARVALERVGIPVEAYYASEIDKYAIQISQKNYPDIVRLGDVKEIRGDAMRAKHILEGGIDLLIGGSPCQDLSIAKKNRKGLDGERSGLFWEYVRILNEVKPKYFILENVNSMPKEAKAIISEALGVEPVMINASLVSAQNRKRLFWVGKWNGEKYEQVVILQPEDRGILLKDILEENVDEKYNVGKDFKFGNSQGNKVYGMGGKSQTLMALGGGGGAKTGLYMVGLIDGKNSQGKRVYSPEGKSVTLGAGSTSGGESGRRTGLYAVEVYKQGKQIGKEQEKSDSLMARDYKGFGNQRMTGVVENSIIRKLTPTECERLQSLPDNYTEGVSNTQRYKALGNAFNVDVVSWILSCIAKV